MTHFCAWATAHAQSLSGYLEERQTTARSWLELVGVDEALEEVDE